MTKYIVEIKKGGKWIVISSHKGEEYALIIAEIKSKTYDTRIKKDSKVIYRFKKEGVWKPVSC